MGASFVHSVLILTGIVRPRKDGFDQVLEYLKAENQELKNIVGKQTEQIRELSEQVNKLRQESMMLRTQIVLLESAQYDLPYPQWMADIDGTIVVGNKAFEDLFLIPLGLSISDVIGKNPGSFLNQESEKEYMQNHRWVLAKKRPWEGAILITREEKPETLDALFYPTYSGKRIVGVSGLIIPAKRVDNY